MFLLIFTTLGSGSDLIRKGLNPVVKENPEAPRYNDLYRIPQVDLDGEETPAAFKAPAYSECYRQEYDCNAAYLWIQPNTYGDDYFNMRMSVAGPETLAAVGIALYDGATAGSPDLDVYVWNDNGTGFPDLSDVIFQTTVPYAGLAYYPNYNEVDLSGYNIVLRNDFHVGWSTGGTDPGDTLGGLSDDGICGAFRSSAYYNGGWYSMLDLWGVDYNFLIYADLCKDEFSDCLTVYDYCNVSFYWELPDQYGDVGNYQKVSPLGVNCRLEKVRVMLYDNGDPGIYTTNSEIQVWASDGFDGLPGTKLGGITVTPAEYVLLPGWTEVDFTGHGITFSDDIWIGIESFAPDELTGIRTLSDDGTCGSRRSCELWAGSFGYMVDDWGTDYNFVMEAEICCVPGGALPYMYDVSFYQLSWLDYYGTPIAPYSVWGGISFKYETDTTEMYYVNLAMSHEGGPFQWVMQNLPLPPALGIERRSDGADINLEEIGIVNGQQVGEVEYILTASTTPILSIPTGPISTILFQSADVKPPNQEEEADAPVNPDPPAHPAGVTNTAPVSQIGSTRDMDPAKNKDYSVQEDIGCCAAGSYARSLDWLNRVHKLGMEKTAQDIYDDLRAKDVSSPNQGGDFSRDEWLEYKNDYARAQSGNRIVTKVWDKYGQMPEVDGVTQTGGDFLAWLLRESKTEDVEIEYIQPNGVPHQITVVDVLKTEDGKYIIKYRDDHPGQGDDNSGDQGIKSMELILNGDGFYALGQANAIIRFGVSESVYSTTSGGSLAEKDSRRVVVRDVLRLHQGKYRQPKVANDLHFKIWIDTRIYGWKAVVPAFGTTTSSADGTQAVKFDAINGAVPYCTNLDIKITLDLGVRNEKRLSEMKWTRNTGDKDLQETDTVKAAPDFGWLIDPPDEIAPGYYQHYITLFNDDLEEGFTLVDIGFMPSNDYVEDLTTLTEFPEIIDTPVYLGPGQHLSHTIGEEGLSDHVYGFFRIVDAEGDTVVHDWLDHPTTMYVCGDANGDGDTNVGDAVFTISYIFLGGPAPVPIEAADANGDGTLNVGDAVYTINYVFNGGPAPACP
jgi:hypothetical protein